MKRHDELIRTGPNRAGPETGPFRSTVGFVVLNPFLDQPGSLFEWVGGFVRLFVEAERPMVGRPSGRTLLPTQETTRQQTS